MHRYVALATVALVLAVCAVPAEASKGTTLKLRMGVPAQGFGETASDPLPDGTVTRQVFRVNGKLPRSFERETFCSGYAYWRGVMLRIDGCGDTIKLRASNMRERNARVVVRMRLAF